jgi:hypothetical protein
VVGDALATRRDRQNTNLGRAQLGDGRIGVAIGQQGHADVELPHDARHEGGARQLRKGCAYDDTAERLLGRDPGPQGFDGAGSVWHAHARETLQDQVKLKRSDGIADEKNAVHGSRRPARSVQATSRFGVRPFISTTRPLRMPEDAPNFAPTPRIDPKRPTGRASAAIVFAEGLAVGQVASV